MTDKIEERRFGFVDILYVVLGALLILLIGIIAKAQSGPPAMKSVNTHSQVQQPQVYREYRGVRLGMSPTEVRAKLGEPVLKSDEQDFFVMSPNETAQIAYNTAKKAVMISTDYTGGVGAPDYKSVVGEGLLEKPDGSLFRMVRYDSERFWVTYSKSASATALVTITIGSF